ncbi:MAG: hypothetical protein J7J20_03370 [Desulfurococcales archaeon]|nr:hypothetical protein [Desulfurococcales archaeon]
MESSFYVDGPYGSILYLLHFKDYFLDMKFCVAGCEVPIIGSRNTYWKYIKFMYVQL